MKPIYLIPPVLSLAIVGGWVGSQRESIGKLERETLVIRQRIEAAKNGGGEAGDRSLVERMGRPGTEAEEGEIDWADVGEGLVAAQSGGMPDMRVMMKLQTQLMSMDAGQLKEALDEIEGLEMTKDIKVTLEGMLVGMLAEKDPQLVVERFVGRMNDEMSGMSWQLSSAFQKWQKKDPVAAVAWFDREIAKGTFDSKSLDGKSQGRLQFEAALLSGLLETDPAAASKRIAGLPEEQRKEIFQQGMFMQLKPGSEKVYAALVRDNVPEDERAEVFGRATTMMIHQGGYEKVSGFLNEIEASDGEREGIVAKVAGDKLQMTGHQGGVDRKALDEMREWVGKEAPEELDKITGQALANVWGDESEFKKRVALVEELHAEGGGDDLLVAFLEGGAIYQYPESAKELVGKIADEGRREKLLKRFGGMSEGGVSPEDSAAPTEREE